jgi:hypothetical protein
MTASPKWADNLVFLALAKAFLDGGSPDVLLIEEVDRFAVAVADESVANGTISAEARETFIIAAKCPMYKAAFIAWDAIRDGDEWQHIRLPWARWTADIVETTRDVTEKAALVLSGDRRRRRCMAEGKSLALAVQRRASELIRGWPLPRAGRTAVVDALSDIAMETFDRRLSELSARPKTEGRA